MKKVLTIVAVALIIIACSSSNNEDNSDNNYSQDCFSKEATTNPFPFTITGTLNDLLGNWKIVKRGYAFCDGTANLIEQQPFGDCNSFRYVHFKMSSGSLVAGVTNQSYVLRPTEDCVFTPSSGYFSQYRADLGIICNTSGKIGLYGMYILEFTPTTFNAIHNRPIYASLGNAPAANLGNVSTANPGDWEYLECIKE